MGTHGSVEIEVHPALAIAIVHQVRANVLLPGSAIFHQEIHVLGRPGRALDPAQHRAVAVAHQPRGFCLLDHFLRATRARRTASHAEPGGVILVHHRLADTEVCHEIKRTAPAEVEPEMVLGQFGSGEMAFRRPLARCFGPEHFKQPHAIGGLPP